MALGAFVITLLTLGAFLVFLCTRRRRRRQPTRQPRELPEDLDVFDLVDLHPDEESTFTNVQHSHVTFPVSSLRGWELTGGGPRGGGTGRRRQTAPGASGVGGGGGGDGSDAPHPQQLHPRRLQGGQGGHAKGTPPTSSSFNLPDPMSCWDRGRRGWRSGARGCRGWGSGRCRTGRRRPASSPTRPSSTPSRPPAASPFVR